MKAPNTALPEHVPFQFRPTQQLQHITVSQPRSALNNRAFFAAGTFGWLKKQLQKGYTQLVLRAVNDHKVWKNVR
jgi:hypothetical protein